MGMDGLGGNTILQSKVAIVSPSSRPGADIDYTFIQIFPDQPAGLSYKMNCGNISSGVPVSPRLHRRGLMSSNAPAGPRSQMVAERKGWVPGLLLTCNGNPAIARFPNLAYSKSNDADQDANDLAKAG
jgi:PrpF protein